MKTNSKNRKIAAVCMVKDEADIIELFIKINSNVIDHFFIMDHSSKDKTLEILVELKNLGYPLTIQIYTDTQYNQVLVTNHLIKMASASGEYDFIVPLDADEFIFNPEKEDLIEIFSTSISAGNCGLLKWTNYAPIHNEYFSTKTPLFDLFRQRNFEPTQFYKVVIPSELAKIGTPTMGNHQFTVNGRDSNYTLLTPFLQHCPVRSSQQIIAKTIIGSHRFTLKTDRKIGEGSHWDEMANKIRRNKFVVCDKTLLEMALLYATNSTTDIQTISIVEDSERIGTIDHKIEFSDFSKINYLENFDNFMNELCTSLRNQKDNF